MDDSCPAGRRSDVESMNASVGGEVGRGKIHPPGKAAAVNFHQLFPLKQPQLSNKWCTRFSKHPSLSFFPSFSQSPQFFTDVFHKVDSF